MVYTMVSTQIEMRNIKYKGKCIKMNEETWLLLKDKRKDSGLSWNMFLLKLLKLKQ